MYDDRLARVRLVLFAALALGCSAATLSGTAAAISASMTASAGHQN